MKGCCVFWIPTIYHQELTPLEGYTEIKDEDISDEVGCPCKLTLGLIDDCNVIVKLNIEEHKELEFTLKRKEAHRNGFFLYEFEVEDSDFGIVGLALKNPIYHCIKGFYHKHQYHSTDCDSILDAYVHSDDNVDVNSPDNDPLVFYLKQYEKRFKDFVEQLEYDAAYLESISEDPEYRDILYREKYEGFNQRCINVLGEVIYYQTLFNSKHNHSYRLDRHNAACKSGDDLYKSALNTENAIARIKLIAENIRNISQGRRANATLKNIEMANEVLTKLTATASSIKSLSHSSIELQKDVQKTLVQGEKSSKLSIRLGWLGAILGLISLGLGILPFFNSKKANDLSNIKENSVEKTISNVVLKEKTDTVSSAISHKDTVIGATKTGIK